MAERMSPAEVREFLLQGTRTGKLATVTADGAPHVAPIWFVLDHDDIIFTTGSSSLKGRNLARDPRVSMCVDDEHPPFSFVVVRGRAVVTHDLDEMLLWATRIGARYMGPERAEEFGRRNAVPGEDLVRVIPRRVVALRDVSD